MKKIYIPLLIILLLLIFVPKITIAETDAGDVSQVIGKEFNIPPEKIPTDMDQIRREYLQKEWTEVIKKNKFLSPVHNFLTKISVVFTILLNYPYEFSLTFLLILAFWLFIAIQTAEAIKIYKIMNAWFAYIIGILLATILAQIKGYEIIATTILNLIFSPENIWLRIILGAIFLGAIAIAIALSRIVKQRLKENLKKNKEGETEQKLKELNAISKGIKKYENP